MTEEFIFEEDESTDNSNRRPFMIAAGGLAIVGVLAVACIAVVLATRGSSPTETTEVAAIETQNAIIAVTNEAVTMTIIALETEAARPTDTPRATATSTPTTVPTQTPRPTNTPVVQQAEEAESGSTDLASGGLGNTPTPIAPLGGTNEGTLPQTGITTWGATVAALVLIGVLFAARRLRSN